MSQRRAGWDELLDCAIALPLFAGGDDPAHLCVLVRVERGGIGLVGARTTGAGLLTAGCIADAAGRTIERVDLLFERAPGVSLGAESREVLASLDHQRRWAAACGGEWMGSVATGFESRPAPAMFVDPHGPKVVGKAAAGVIELLPSPGRLSTRRSASRSWEEHTALIDQTLGFAERGSRLVAGRALMASGTAGEAAVEWLWLRARLLAQSAERLAAFTRSNTRPLLSVGNGVFAIDGGRGLNGGPPDLWTASPMLNDGGSAVGIDVPERGVVYIDPARRVEHSGLTITLRKCGTDSARRGWGARGEIEGLPAAGRAERAGRVRLMHPGGMVDALTVVSPADAEGGTAEVELFIPGGQVGSGGSAVGEALNGILGQRLPGGSAELSEVRGSTDDLEDFSALAASCLLVGDQTPEGVAAQVVRDLAEGRQTGGARLCAGAAALPKSLRGRVVVALETIGASAARMRATAPSGLVDGGVFEEAAGALWALCAAARSMLLVDFNQAAEVRSALRAAAERLGVRVG